MHKYETEWYNERASQVEGFSFLFEGFRQRLALLSTIRDYKHVERDEQTFFREVLSCI